MGQPGFRLAFAVADDATTEAMGMLAARSPESERNYYEGLWAQLKIKPEWLATTARVANALAANKTRYENVAKMVGNVPWWFVAIVHQLEGSASFSTHLHNGEPLTRRTRLVPAGRPAKGEPPFTWEESAVDALQLQGIDKRTTWDIATVAFEFEAYNGFGYRSRRVVSPYLAAQSNLWSKGKFVADGQYDPNAGSSQIGALVLLRRMVELGIASIDGQVLPEGDGAPPLQEIVRKGDSGPWVSVLQHTLNGCGYGPLTVDGDFGKATLGELLEFQRNVGVEADGEAGPVTWKALKSHAKIPGWVPLNEQPKDQPQAGLRSRVVAQAKAYASQGRSHAPGNWIDTNVLDPLRATLVSLGHWPKNNQDGFYDWCGAWVCAVMRQAGVDVPDRFSGEWASVALVESWKGWAKRNGGWIPVGAASPQPGDIVIFDWDGDLYSDHIGIVLEARAGGVLSAEGNRRNSETIAQRPNSQISGFVRLEVLQSRIA